MKVAILGTRGIPNNYGGFEQFAEYLSRGFSERGHDVTVYSPHDHPYKKNEWEGVTIKYIYDPEGKIGTAGQFVYDLLSILHTRKKNYDIILQLGYTSSAIFFGLHPVSSIIVTNMDGLEWKRTKFSKKIQRFLRFSESIAVKRSHYLVADSLGIKSYLTNTYNAKSTYIPYGAHVFDSPCIGVLKEFGLKEGSYNMLIARLEPENSIEVILDGVIKSNNVIPFLVIGGLTNHFSKYLKDKFEDTNIQFLGAVYDINVLNNLRYFSNIYFHGHTVGGTNPSLLEAMASNCLICAHNNSFNSSILEEDALYFSDSDDVASHLNVIVKRKYDSYLSNNIHKINSNYLWKKIIIQYESLFTEILAKKVIK